MEWRDVVGYEGLYEVSTTGEVRTHPNKTTYTERHGIRRWKQRTLSQKVCKRGDRRVNLWKDGKPKTFLVHRLVAIAFLPKIEGKDFINHRDGNPSNNDISNLEWCTYEENTNHAFDEGLIQTSHAIVLIDNGTGDSHSFRSMSKASQFLGRNMGYVSGLLKQGINTTGNYEIKRNQTRRAYMAHETQIKGAVSELTVARALLSNGWEVSLPAVDEVYDLVIRDPFTREFKTAQVKTIRRREDRGNEMVVYAKKGNGVAYTPQDCDYIIGVEGDDVYMFECTGKREYWAGDVAAAKRWIKFSTIDWVEPRV